MAPVLQPYRDKGFGELICNGFQPGTETRSENHCLHGLSSNLFPNPVHDDTNVP